MNKIINKVQTTSLEEFKRIVAESKSYIEILNKLGYKRSGRLQVLLKERIEKENIDISHFRNWGNINKQSLDEVLIENSTYNNQSLKKRIIKDNLIEHKCENCGNKGSWNEKKLTLQLHHKNGKSKDHRLGNLCFLCPNCHSQTETYGGKNLINKSLVEL